MRRLRFIPPGSLVEVTCRTVQGRLLLRPDRQVNELIVGVLARATRRYPVRLHHFWFLSNHYHLLVTVDSAQQLAAFMNYVNSNIAREIGRIRDWPERFWGRRYQAVIVGVDEASQLSRLVYLLSQGTKENLVRSPREWPGANPLGALLEGKPIRGRWVDRTLAYRSRRSLVPLDPSAWNIIEELELAPLPCWIGLSEEQRRQKVHQLVAAIEHEAAELVRRNGAEPLGLARVLRQDPHQRAHRLKRTPVPLVHALDASSRRNWRRLYERYRDAYREAAARLSRGALDVVFPAGSFPPALPCPSPT